MFGGHLTSQTQTDEPSGTAGPGGLRADTPDFVPGQPIKQHPRRQAPKPQAPKYPLAPKSTAPDLPTRIHQDIANGQYECVICSSEVLRSSRIWSCTTCWTVVHLHCVKKWHKSQLEKQTRPDQSEEEAQQPKTWRCPGCNSGLTEEPSTYHCWCGKDINPTTISSRSPHSCGQTCTKPRATCPHPCYSECHAGPCLPCELMGPTQPCYCGKQDVTKRCIDTDYDNGWSCQQVCGDLLPCGEHTCERPCHPGLCGGCEVPIASRCYCGRVQKDVPCNLRGDVLSSYNYGQIASDVPLGQPFDGSFECDSPCGRKYDCGEHECEKPCHPQDENEAHCPLSPDVVLNCPCGKTPLDSLLDQPRQTCQDEIPHCKEKCDKIMACGHHCQQTCHVGPCPSCFQSMNVACRCGRTSNKTLCHGADVATPMCMRVCQAQLNCGRHQCLEHCCAGEKKAMERQAAAKKRNHGPVSDEIEAEHICIRVCGRTLKCGSHQCQQICHRGPCPSCLEAVFEEISCRCGRTVLQPPQPCGTRAPECRFDCTERPACGHPAVKHNCHDAETPCPKCPFLVEKPCVCGKKMLKNQPCWFEEVRCGLPCGARLKCGAHSCQQSCHRPGRCEDADTKCAQPCGKPRRSCGHADQDACHAPYPCKEERPCQSRTFITCACQHRKKEIKCLATRANPDPERETLKCDEECLRLQRNQRLAAALNIDPATHTDDHVPYSEATMRYAREHMRWAETQERELRVFASDIAEKRLRLKPMPAPQRAFIHHLADDFGLDTESQDPEPHRHVSVFKTPRFVSAPGKTLAQCVRIRNAQAASAARVGASSAEAALRSLPAHNALLVSGPRFALTVEELDAALAADLSAHKNLSFSTSFLPSDEVLIRASPVTSWGSSAAAVESALGALRPVVARTLVREGLANAVALVHADADLNILRREAAGEAKASGAAGGWNDVVGRAAKARAQPAVREETRPARGGFVSFSKAPRKKLVEDVDEDWEAAAQLDDEA
ncbi:transcriptional repressor NF-X1 [Plectosphaerella cucumerina]|uniref:Transcriptional repressor NF-X1 n=1 Tax=Plectosphaerella cucumerina TaxID=40658 RepID=A0A8K0TVL2_9PEZI|nr:transcriptional repressor NF-X1 [Plectosphaerella cucumerina]